MKTGLKEEGGIEIEIYSASIHYNDNYNSIIVTKLSKLEKKTFLR